MSYPLRIDMPCGPEVMAGVLSPSQMDAIRRNSELTRLEQAALDAALEFRETLRTPLKERQGDEWMERYTDTAKAFCEACDRLISERGE